MPMKTPQIKILAWVFPFFKVSEQYMQQSQYDVFQTFKALHVRGCKCNWSLGPWDLGDFGTAPTVDAFQIFTIVWLTKEDLKISVNTGAGCSAQCFSTTHTEAAPPCTFPRVTALCWVGLAISRSFFYHEGPVNPSLTPIRDIYYSFNTPLCLSGITGYLSALYLLSVSVLIRLYLSFDLSLLAVSPVVSKRVFLLSFNFFFFGHPEFV